MAFRERTGQQKSPRQRILLGLCPLLGGQALTSKVHTDVNVKNFEGFFIMWSRVEILEHISDLAAVNRLEVAGIVPWCIFPTYWEETSWRRYMCGPNHHIGASKS